jgi:hypothetical protein
MSDLFLAARHFFHEDSMAAQPFMLLMAQESVNSFES